MNYYLEENVIKTEEHLHGDYKLIIKTYDTKKISGRSTWDYTEGFIYFNNVFVGSIKRNYSRFPFCFFGKYLISGRSYMRQTIIQCETGQIYDNTDDQEISDFCWSEISQLDENTLVVYGCVWGGSYEYCFFDVSDVEKGWPMLEVADELIKKDYLDYGCSTEHTVKDNILTITYFEDWDEDDIPIVDLKIELQRENNMIKLINVTMSGAEKIKQEEKEIKRTKDEQIKTELRNNSQFYLKLIPLVNDLGLRIQDWIILHSNSFNINVHKKSKSCFIEFNTGDVTFKYYDWQNTKNNLVLKFDQDVNLVDDIINKIKELLK